jgi:HEAT repeat protein
MKSAAGFTIDYAGGRAVKNDPLKAKLDALQLLRKADAETAAAGARKALTDRSNYVIAKAARIAGDLSLAALVPDLLTAFDRLFDDPLKTDQLCLGKSAIAKVLKDFELHEPAPFIRGLNHIQMEPVYGGFADTAGGLRATSAQALVACNLDDTSKLEHLVDHLTDSDKAVRLDVIIAIAHFARPESAMLLRLKASSGDPEPEVVGQCFLSLLDLAPADSIAFIARFLKSTDSEIVFEAAAALAQSREPAAFEVVQHFWREKIGFDLRRAIVMSLAGSPQPAVADFLIALISGSDRDIAKAAISALAASRFREDAREKTLAAVDRARDRELSAAFLKVFNPE